MSTSVDSPPPKVTPLLEPPPGTAWKPTEELRFLRRWFDRTNGIVEKILQQKWIAEFNVGPVEVIKSEWRDVQVVDDES